MDLPSLVYKENEKEWLVNLIAMIRYELLEDTSSILFGLESEVKILFSAILLQPYVFTSRPKVELLYNRAHEKIYSYPFKLVPREWIGLFADLSLLLAWYDYSASSFDAAIACLDRALIICGAVNCRIDSYARIIQASHSEIKNLKFVQSLTRGKTLPTSMTLLPAWFVDQESSFNYTASTFPKIIYPVGSLCETEDADSIDHLCLFQMYLDRFRMSHRGPAPLVWKKFASSWPAIKLWNDPLYLLNQSQDGTRLVPVEIGSSYVSKDWTQQLMTFKSFLVDYIITQSHAPQEQDQPLSTGYLAEFNLFVIMPYLRRDITVPDLVYANIMPADLDYNYRHVSEEIMPIINTWFGPKGTISPLHTDPYHNIFTQVVGYKYVRLYPPQPALAGQSMYARSACEDSIDRSNTSKVSLENIDNKEVRAEFPDFPWDKGFVETLLGPGDVLYIPAGWWHFVQSQTISFSVSFWF